mmetsp:Transcript_97719/g.277006  ORF Transcript_97719/g.277006 Transcript_97719/m.277006 type:complete len:325 (+) Transcript_97719:840-1814(+)
MGLAGRLDTAVLVGHAPPVVEGHTREGHEVEADAADHEAARDVLAGRAGLRRDLLAGLPAQRRPVEADPGHARAALVRQDGGRREQEAEPDDPFGGRLALGEVRGHLFEDAEGALFQPARRELLLARRVPGERKLLRIDDREDPVQIQELAELRVREGRLDEAAPADHLHGPQAPLLPPGDVRERLRVYVGRVQLLGGAHQDARHVEGDVALPQHYSGLADFIGHRHGDVRVAIVPLHERRRANNACELLAGDAKDAFALSAGAHDHCVVVILQRADVHVCADLHVAEESEVRHLGHLGEVVGHVLDFWVVGRDTKAHQTERHR